MGSCEGRLVDVGVGRCVTHAVTACARVLQVHKYVGCEPSGLEFNDFSFNYRNVPYNPMINTGAIVVGSLLSPGMEMHQRFKAFIDRVTDMAGGTARCCSLLFLSAV